MEGKLYLICSYKNTELLLNISTFAKSANSINTKRMGYAIKQNVLIILAASGTKFIRYAIPKSHNQSVGRRSM